MGEILEGWAPALAVVHGCCPELGVELGSDRDLPQAGRAEGGFGSAAAIASVEDQICPKSSTRVETWVHVLRSKLSETDCTGSAPIAGVTKPAWIVSGASIPRS